MGAEMDEKLMSAISEYVTQPVNDLGADAPETITDAITQADSCLKRLAAALSPAQSALLRELEDALGLREGEETRYYYRAGFYDAVRFLLEWSDAD